MLTLCLIPNSINYAQNNAGIICGSPPPPTLIHSPKGLSACRMLNTPGKLFWVLPIGRSPFSTSFICTGSMVVMATTAVQLLLTSYNISTCMERVHLHCKHSLIPRLVLSYRERAWLQEKSLTLLSIAALANEHGHIVVLASVAVPNRNQTGFWANFKHIRQTLLRTRFIHTS